MIRKPLCVLVGIALVAGAVGCARSDQGADKGVAGNGKEEQAIAAAEVWLETVDAGDYSESWEASAELFRKVVSKEQWVQSLLGVRAPLGKLVSRELACIIRERRGILRRSPAISGRTRSSLLDILSSMASSLLATCGLI